MKIQCRACEAAEAKVLCCADDAAFCSGCDEKVHAANNLARKHQRVRLSSSSSPMPKCDICQETIGYFFCLEDRALLCRKCDVAIHTANSYVSGHPRFLLNGVKVGLEATKLGESSSKENLNKSEKVSSPRDLPGRGDVVPSSGQFNEAVSGYSIAGGSRPSQIPEWHLEEYFGSTSNLYESSEKRTKVCDVTSQDSGWLQILQSIEDVLCNDNEPENLWIVP